MKSHDEKEFDRQVVLVLSLLKEMQHPKTERVMHLQDVLKANGCPEDKLDEATLCGLYRWEHEFGGYRFVGVPIGEQKGDADLATVMRVNGIEPTPEALDKALTKLRKLESAAESAVKSFARAGIQ